MVKRLFKLRPPVDDRQMSSLDSDIANIYQKSLQNITNTYTGTGISGVVVKVGFKPTKVDIYRVFQKNQFSSSGTSLAGEFATTLVDMGGISFISGSGYVNNAIIAIGVDSFTLGTHPGVNAYGVTYLYYAVG